MVRPIDDSVLGPILPLGEADLKFRFSVHIARPFITLDLEISIQACEHKVLKKHQFKYKAARSL